MQTVMRILAFGLASLFSYCLNIFIASVPVGYISSSLCTSRYQEDVWTHLNESYIKASAATAPRLERLQRKDVVDNTYQVQGMERAMNEIKLHRPLLARMISPTHLLMYPKEPEVPIGFAIAETTIFPFVMRVYYGLAGRTYWAYGCRTYLCFGSSAVLYDDLPVELASPAR